MRERQGIFTVFDPLPSCRTLRGPGTFTKVFCKFGKSGTKFVGRSHVQLPTQGVVISFIMYFIDADLLTPLSLADKDFHGVYKQNLTEFLVHHYSQEKANLPNFYGSPLLP